MADNSVSVIIEEIGPSPPLRVELLDTDLPFGRVRQISAYETGGTTELPGEDGIHLPSSGRVVFQPLFIKRRPLVIRGAFRDSQKATKGHAKDMRNQLKLVQSRANIVRILILNNLDGVNNEEYQGFLKDTKFGEEGPGDITYELSFSIAVDSEATQEKVTLPTPKDNSDAVRQMQEEVSGIGSSLAFAIPLAKLIVATLIVGVDKALASLLSDLEFAARGIASTRLAAIDTSAAVASAELAGLRTAMLELSPSSLRTPNNSAALTALAVDRFNSLVTILHIQGGLRDIRRGVALASRRVVRLYQVRDGDTLESIAQSQLGSRARAGDLGIQEYDLKPGSVIRIPEAA